MADQDQTPKSPQVPDKYRDRRLAEQMHQKELTESRVNEDFVQWLKTSGPTWLIAILLGVAGFMGVMRWKEYAVQAREEAWIALAQSTLPSSLEDVAEEHEKYLGVRQLARLRAAGQHLRAVQTNRPLSEVADPAATDPNEERPELSEDERSDHLTQADRLFQTVLGDDDGSDDLTIYMTNALFGRAAVAEAQGDLEGAKGFYEQAAQRAGDYAPQIAARAERRIESLERLDTVAALPTTAELPALDRSAITTPGRSDFSLTSPIRQDPVLRDIIFPEG